MEHLSKAALSRRAQSSTRHSLGGMCFLNCELGWDREVPISCLIPTSIPQPNLNHSLNCVLNIVRQCGKEARPGQHLNDVNARQIRGGIVSATLLVDNSLLRIYERQYSGRAAIHLDNRRVVFLEVIRVGGFNFWQKSERLPAGSSGPTHTTGAGFRARPQWGCLKVGCDEICVPD